MLRKFEGYQSPPSRQFPGIQKAQKNCMLLLRAAATYYKNEVSAS